MKMDAYEIIWFLTEATANKKKSDHRGEVTSY